MQYFRFFIATIAIWLGLINSQILAQEIERSVLSSAYYTSSDYGEWVIGETFISDLNGNQLMATGGFLQGDLLSTGFSANLDPVLSFEVYPNPFSQIIYIRHNAASPLRVEIHDIFGRIIYFRDILGTDTFIDLLTHSTGTYFLKYYTRNGSLGVIPIYKVQ